MFVYGIYLNSGVIRRILALFKKKRQKFLKYGSILLLAATVVLAGFTLFYMPIIRNQAIIDLAHHKTEQTVSRFNELIRPMVTNLSVLRRWGEDNILDYDDVPELNRLLLPIFDLFHLFSICWRGPSPFCLYCTKVQLTQTYEITTI